MPQKQYKSMSDNELLRVASEDEAAYSEIISRELSTVRRLARTYSFNGSDYDDLASEGLIGLMNAVKSYNPERGESSGASFSTYAYACINNRIISALKKSNIIQSCEENIDDAGLSEPSSPESIVLTREEMDELLQNVNSDLSKTEKSVFELYILGYSYPAIAKDLGISVKSVDNALFRTRRKLRRKSG